MASGSSSTTQLTPKSSRFSTSLKVFKFGSKDKEAKPPPLPPKDAYYLRNRSLASLSPDSLSIPNTPVTPGFQQSRGLFPDMNKSTISLISAAPSFRSTSKTDPSSHRAPKKEKSGFFRFPKRQKSQTRSPTTEDVPPLPSDDGSISMPWNFQHNIHVDEGFVGLPPSWVTSLTQAGFSPEEIENIQHRRAAARSPTSQYATSIRPLSPPSDTPIVTNPVPRTTSLPRKQSKSSLASSDNIHLSRLLPQRQQSVEQGMSTSFLDTDPMESRLPVIDISSTQRSPSRSDSIRSVGSTKLSPPSRPVPPAPNEVSKTSPQRFISDSEPYLERQDSRSGRNPPIPTSILKQTSKGSPNIPTPESSVEGSDTELNTNLVSLPTLPPLDTRQKRATALPPRLSLPQQEEASDLSSWGEALLSGISSANDATPGTSAFTSAQESKLSAETRAGRSDTLGETNHAYYERMRGQADRKKASPPRVSPPHPLHGVSSLTLDLDEEEEDPLGSSWVEPASTARYDPEATSWDDDDDDEPDIPTRPVSELPSPLPTGTSPLFNTMYKGIQSNGLEPPLSAALSESASAILPDSPNNRNTIIAPPVRGDTDIGILEDKSLLKAGNGKAGNRDSSRSSTSTVMAEPATIVRSVSIIRRAAPVVIASPKAEQPPRRIPPEIQVQEVSRHSPSPLSSHGDSEGRSTPDTGSSSPTSYEQQTPMTDGGLESPLTYYYDSTPSPDPSKLIFPPSPAYSEKSGRPRIQIPVDDPPEEDEDDFGNNRPRIVINDAPSTGLPTPIPSGTTPKTPFQRYPGWLSSVVEPLEEFIDEAVDPRNHYLDLHEIAEGESGSVFAARLSPDNRHKLKLTPAVKAQDQKNLVNGATTLIAIKSVAILPTGSPKLTDLQRELSLMRGLAHEHILTMDAVYVDLVEDSLWIRMELMERSLADVIALVPHGLMLQQDRLFARFASDVLLALDFLQQHRIAHRDVRSDNLLLNGEGLLKLADFSTAVCVPSDKPLSSESVGVVYWQAPEIRSGPYDALQVDVWSLGATVWEMAEAEPPFAETQQVADRWPPLRQPELFSPGFHDFLRQCSLPPASRPKPAELGKTAFINNACGRAVVIQILSQCMAIEHRLQLAEDAQ